MRKKNEPSAVTVVIPVDKICPQCEESDHVELNAILNTNRINWYFLKCDGCGNRTVDKDTEEAALSAWPPAINGVPSQIHNMAFDLCRHLPTRTLHDIVSYINESTSVMYAEPGGGPGKDTRSLVTCISTWLQAYFADMSFLD